MGKIPGIRGPAFIQTRQLRIAKLAKCPEPRALTSLAHHIDVFWMHEAYKRTRKDGAVGVDGETAAEFEKDLTGNLKTLVEELKSGNFKAQPVKRKMLEKADGGQRPIGIPTLRDKIMQRAVVMVMEPLYEQVFHDFSHGFRPGRSMHQTIEVMRNLLWERRGGWLVEVDIRGFFDNIDHRKLRECLDIRMRDGVLRRAIDKWLRAGALDGETLYTFEEGTPQGGVISPILSNIFLHEVMDDWFVKDVMPRVSSAKMIRYADDLIMIFDTKAEAERVLEVTRKRFAKFGLELHPEKTRIVNFRKPPWKGYAKGEKPGTYDFLGFTFYWYRCRKGTWIIGNKTRRKSFRGGLRNISEWCAKHRHKKVLWQHKELGQKIQGHYSHFAIPGNSRSLSLYLYQVKRIWGFWLRRRSQKKHLSWKVFYERLTRNPLPAPRIARHRRPSAKLPS